jgi:heat-inducible transcriptional repressor
MSLRDEILRSVVIHYITDETPIGSVQLQKEFDIESSSATIRNHFKKLVLEGMLEQLHSSSGRIPTNEALIAYWIKEFNHDAMFRIRSLATLERAAKEFDIYAVLHSDEADKLQSIESRNGETIILSFEKGVAAIPYNRAVERFLGDFLGLDVVDLINVARQIGLGDVSSELMKYVSKTSHAGFNPQTLITLASRNPAWSEEYFDLFYTGAVSFLMKKGINSGGMVPNGCIVGKHTCLMGGHRYTLTYLGESSKDFRTFLLHM